MNDFRKYHNFISPSHPRKFVDIRVTIILCICTFIAGILINYYFFAAKWFHYEINSCLGAPVGMSNPFPVIKKNIEKEMI